MKYFVSIENCYFFRWQIELLLESMKPFGLDDSLVIGCAEFENKKIKFPNVIYHENIGRKNNYLPFNKPFSVIQALKNKLLTPPFVIIDPDMVMVKPIENTKFVDYSYYLEYDNLICQGYTTNDLGCKTNWLPGGFIYQVDFFNIDFFEEIISKIHELLSSNLIKDKWQIEMIAFAYCYSKYTKHICKKVSTSLFDNKTYNFIHYANGFSPYFNKYNYNNLREITFDYPYWQYKSILEIPDENDNIKILKNIVSKFLINKNMKYIYEI